MAHIAVYVSAQSAGAVSPSFRLGGGAFVSTANPNINIPWETADIPFTATPDQVNRAVQNAAIAAALVEGHSVTPFDNWIVIGAAVGGV